MNIEEIKTTAALAQLELSDNEADKLAEAVSQMLEYFTKMNEVDIEGLEPTTHALLKNNRTRKDKVKDENISDELLELSPELEDRFIVIPNVL